MEETTINQPFVGVVYLRTLILLDKYSHLLQIGTHYKYTIILRFIILINGYSIELMRKKMVFVTNTFS